MGGKDLENNSRLASAISRAKSFSFPKDSIDSIISRALGDKSGKNMEEIIYEGQESIFS